MRPHPFMTEIFCDPIFRKYPLATENFHNPIFCDYPLVIIKFLRLPRPQPSFVKILTTPNQLRETSRHTQDTCNTIPARFPLMAKITGNNFSHGNYPE